MKNVYIPNVGETAKMVTSMIKRNLKGKQTKKDQTLNTKEKTKKKIDKKEERPARIEKMRNGTFHKSDLKYLIAGCDFLRIVGDAGIEAVTTHFSSKNEKMNPKTAKAILALKVCRGPIYDFLDMCARNLYAEYDSQRELANLENMYEIIDKSRDGIITRKQEIKDSNGQKTEIEIAMSESEIYISTKTACSNSKDFSLSVYEVTKNLEYAKSSLRISLSYLTTDEEITYFLKVFKEKIKELSFLKGE